MKQNKIGGPYFYNPSIKLRLVQQCCIASYPVLWPYLKLHYLNLLPVLHTLPPEVIIPLYVYIL